MKQLERLAGMASRRDAPAPLDAESVMVRVRGLRIRNEIEIPPVRFFAGGAMAAAAAAVFVTVLGMSAWDEISNPMMQLESLVNLASAVGGP